MENNNYAELLLELPLLPAPRQIEKEKEAEKPTYEVNYNVKLFELDI